MAEFKIKDKETGEIFTIREKDSESSQDSPKSKSNKDIAIDAGKQTLRNVLGQGFTEFIPGMESPIMKAGTEFASQTGQNITNKLGVPSTPNLPELKTISFPAFLANSLRASSG